jgi:hypothetical protein
MSDGEGSQEESEGKRFANDGDGRDNNEEEDRTTTKIEG